MIDGPVVTGSSAFADDDELIGQRKQKKVWRGNKMTQDFTARRAYNAAAELVDANVARGLSDKVAFTDPERSLTYGELQKDSCRFARGLAALGLEQESRVALLMLDTVDFPIAFWGAIRAGIV